MTPHQKGLALTCFGGLLLSFDIPVIRLASGEVWSVMMLRSISIVAFTLGIWLLIRIWRGRGPILMPGRSGILVTLLYGASTVPFILSVFYTSTANVAFILAFNPMFGALLSWIFLKERPALKTIVAMLVMIGGITLIVEDGLQAGHLLGDSMAALSAFLAAGALTLSRANGGEFGFTPLVSMLIPAVIGTVIVSQSGYNIEVPGWVLFNGILLTPVAMWCLATGPRHLTAPEVGMFYLLETILAPIWVWLLFSDTLSLQALAGGAIVLSALIVHSVLLMRRPAIIGQPVH